MFDPKSTRYPYPEFTDQHYLVVKKNDGTVFDKDYPYLDNSRKARANRGWTRFLLYLIVFPVAWIRFGLRIKNRKNLKKYKSVLKNGVVSVANHIALWDYICVMDAVRPYVTNVLVWDVNMRGENAKLMRSVGGIPIPVNNPQGTMVMNKSVIEHLKNGGWLHIYPEGSMWEMYAPIRPFKPGAAYYAISSDRPILPLAFSYRKPGWIRRKIFKQEALFTLSIGEPIYRDPTLTKAEQEVDLIKRSHDAVCGLAGIKPEENLYEPIFKNSHKINYY